MNGLLCQQVCEMSNPISSLPTQTFSDTFTDRLCSILNISNQIMVKPGEDGGECLQFPYFNVKTVLSPLPAQPGHHQPQQDQIEPAAALSSSCHCCSSPGNIRKLQIPLTNNHCCSDFPLFPTLHTSSNHCNSEVFLMKSDKR